MRLGKTILVVVGATVMLAALVGAASAGRLSTSELNVSATWARLNYGGGLGTVECEVVVGGRFHQRTISKTVGALAGLVTAGNVNRCSRGSGTVLRETLPWHVQYAAFAGTLPNITAISAYVIGMAFRIREPTFGITCLVHTESEEPGLETFNLTSGIVVSVTAGGEIETSCGIAGALSGTSTSVSPGNIRITLI